MPNPGKVFEEDFFKSFPDNISIDRFYDVMGGRKGINTICDFVVYEYPFQYYFELKSIREHTFPFSLITENQYSGLLKKNGLSGVTAGVVIQYRLDDIAIFLNIQSIKALIDGGVKSISVRDAKVLGYTLPGDKKRVHWDYNIPLFLHCLRNRVKKSD